MIYVISEAAFLDNINANNILEDGFYIAEACIKIGYASNESRLNSYITDSPKYYRLFTLEGEQDDEIRLHNYFDNYRDDGLNGREWFRWSKEIIDFFETYKTIEEIRKVLDDNNIPHSKKYNDLVENAKSYMFPILSIMVDLNLIDDDIKTFFELDKLDQEMEKSIIIKKLFNHYLSKIVSVPKSSKDFIKYLKNELDEEVYNKVVEKYYWVCSFDLSKELEEYDKQTQYTQKMEYICNLSKKLDKDKFEAFLYYMPIDLKNYYTILGSEKCKALEYRKIELERELSKRIGNQYIDIKSEIYKTFQVDERYLKSQIKETLRDLYKRLGYKKTPMANDLFEFFEVKEIQIKNPITKKKDHGYLILKRLKDI